MSDTVKPMLQLAEERLPRLVIFLSGGGSNAERILERAREAEKPPFEVAALVTDAPERSRAQELGSAYGLPVISHDIRRFYQDHGEKRVSIASARGQELRLAWTEELRLRLAEVDLDFAVFAGFVTLTNITADFPCLNVHPGDLTYLKDGRRHLVGLHTVPIERSILEGLDYLRSSVIQALPYTGKGDDMDNGPILGISGPVEIDLQGHAVEELQEVFESRPPRRPKGGYEDILEHLAEANQQRLKEMGDWTVLPPVVFDFAQGKFGLGHNGGLCYRLGKTWHPVETVIYAQSGEKDVLFRGATAG